MLSSSLVITSGLLLGRLPSSSLQTFFPQEESHTIKQSPIIVALCKPDSDNNFIFNTDWQFYLINSMKNKAILSFLLLLSTSITFAQDGKFKLGLRFAPSLSSINVQDLSEKDDLAFSGSSSGLRFSAGLSGDFYFGRNYSFYTGVWYSVMKSGIKAEYTNPISKNKSNAESITNLQYLQIPLALKLFTNEVAPDVKLYFVVGGTAGIKIQEKKVSYKDETNSFIEPALGKGYSFGDVGLLLGAGAEYRLGESTTVFGGFSYNRGLLNVPSAKGPLGAGKNSAELYDLSLNQISLEMGIKF
jgi:hypothetical protein